jgi:hypothetical protein
VSVTSIEGFEGGIATTQLSISQSNSGMFYTAQTDCSGTYVSTASKRTGTYGYQKTGTSYGSSWVYFNFTGLGSNVITNITFYLKLNSGSGNGEIIFDNKTNGAVVHLHLATLEVQYKDDVSVTHAIASLSGWTKISFNIYSETGLCYYTVGNTTVNGIVNNPVLVANNNTIDGIRLFFGTTDSFYIDDLSWVTSGSYDSGGGTNPEHDFSIYKTIGSFPDVTVFSVGDYTENEGRYDIPFTGTVRGIDIFSANTFSSNWSYIWNLQIGGIACAPTTFYNYSYGSSSVCTAIRFDFIDTPISFDNEKIVIEVRNPCKNPYSGYYYQVMYSDSSTWRGTADIDLDGDTQAYKSNNPPNDVYDGSFLISNSEFFYVIYYEGGIGGNPEEETDYNFLTISGNNMNFNATGSPLFTVNDTVVIGWGISDLTVDNYITIEYEGTEITTGGFPYTIYNAKGSYGFSPENAGNYTVYLYCDDVLVRTKTFTVIEETNPEFILYSVHTTPPITYDFQTY